MTSLADFTFPSNENVTTCEKNSRLLSNPASSIPDYRKIDLALTMKQRKNLVYFNGIEKPIFLNIEETLTEKLLTTWEKKGMTGVLEFISTNSNTPHIVSMFAKTINDSRDLFNKWKAKLFQEEVMKLKDKSYVCMATHPYSSKFAVCLPSNPNEVKIFNTASSSNDHELVLKDKRINDITFLSWRPKSSMSLAVASRDGILVWFIDGSTLRPGSSTTRFLESSELLLDITSLSWCEDGVLLAASCFKSASFIVWNVVSNHSTVIQRAGSPTAFIKWSPCGKHLLSSTETDIFRVWETNCWTCEKWADLNGKCTNACWSYDGSILLFTVEKEPFIYAINFYQRNTGSFHSNAGNSGVATKCADLTQLNDEGVGGFISNMTWDSTNSRLAKDGLVSQRNIALFHTKTTPFLQFIPCGFIQGELDERPLAIDFSNNFEKGAQLLVYWSSNMISAIPCYFNKDLIKKVTPVTISPRDLLHDTVNTSVSESTWMS